MEPGRQALRRPRLAVAWPIALTWLLGTVLTVVVVTRIRRTPGSDDFEFLKHIEGSSSVFAWVSQRYETWSGRVFPEAFIYFFTPAPLIIWQLATIALFLATVALLYSYSRIWYPAAGVGRRVMALTLAFALPFLIDVAPLKAGLFWVTGAMNYFWILPFALAAFYPIVYFYRTRSLPPWYALVAAFLCTIVASSSQEQIGAVLTVLTIVVATDRAIDAIGKRSWRGSGAPYAIVLAIATSAAFATLMSAPGNALRLVIDEENWLPDFSETSGSDRLQYAIRFLVDSMVNRSGVLLIAIWVLLLVILMRKLGKDRIDLVLLGAMGLALATTAMRGMSSSTVLFSLYPYWEQEVLGVLPVAVLLFWVVVLAITVMAPVVILRDRVGIILSLLLAASITCVAVMTQSPSMYASGARVLFVTALLLAIVVYALLQRVLSTASRANIPIVVGVLFIAAYQYGILVRDPAYLI